MKISSSLLGMTILLLFVSLASAQRFTVSERAGFGPQRNNILLLEDSTKQKKIILFRTKLRVNTDGSPLSYHPQDPRGKSIALNIICNAVVIKHAGDNKNLCFTNFGEAIGAFEKFRDGNYRTIPETYEIGWSNVLATTMEQGISVPCIFGSGPFKGYFGSLTALKNGLTGDKGECQFNDQVNPLSIPALVLAGGKNAVRQFGAKVGDLLVAYNSKNDTFSSAIIGDTGPGDNLGEGSIFLNMKLKGVTIPPTNRAETFKLAIENDDVLVAIFPASRSFREMKPFTVENIDQRVVNWQRALGFATPEKFIEFMKSFQSSLK